MCGSLQGRSSTAAVLGSVGDLVTVAGGGDSDVTFETFGGLEALPHFNPDRDVDQAPTAVAVWRAALADADAVVIATPEYAHSFPGALKDALDWTVGSGELVGKPVLLVTASGGGGVRAGEGLLPVLRVLSTQLVGPVSIWGVSPKVVDGRLTDADDLAALSVAVDELLALARPSTDLTDPTDPTERDH